MESSWVKKSKVFSKRWIFLVVIFLILVIAVSSTTFWVKSSFAAPGDSDEEVIFVIQEGESTVSIAERLKEEGLIKSISAFRLFARFSCEGMTFSNPTSFLKTYEQKDCLAGNIQAGSYKLASNMDLPTLSKNLTKGRLDSWTRITEGMRNEEIAAIVAKNYTIKEEDFLKLATIGYMFPDSYLFSVDSKAEDIVTKLRSTFDQKFTPALQEKVKAQGLTVEEAVILASIIERETNKDPVERATVAGILLNRINSGWKLEADATVQYALGYDEANKTWWKKTITAEDLNVDSPYNTRRFVGLPPGPISNPGLSALTAVAEPVESDYYFYLHGNDGTIRYAKTLAEHNQNKALYIK